MHPNYLRSYGLTGLCVWKNTQSRSNGNLQLRFGAYPRYEDAQFSDPVSPHILWEDRFDSVRHMELHAARNNTVILKFMLHVSKQGPQICTQFSSTYIPDNTFIAEQAARLLNRINVPSRNWKFSHSDLSERAVWGHYMKVCVFPRKIKFLRRVTPLT